MTENEFTVLSITREVVFGHTQPRRKVYSGLFGQIQCKFFFVYSLLIRSS